MNMQVLTKFLQITAIACMAWLFLCALFRSLVQVGILQEKHTRLFSAGKHLGFANKQTVDSPLSDSHYPFIRLVLLSLGAVVITRFLLSVSIYLFQPHEGSYMSSLEGLWSHWDTQQYMNIATRGYVTQGDHRLAIVFYPLYPFLLASLNLLVHNAFISGTILSNACLCTSLVLLFRLVEARAGQTVAWRAWLLLLLCPLSFFFSVPMSESLFICLTLAALLCAIRHQFLLACILGGFSAFTRSLGVLIAIPIFVEMLAHMQNQEEKRLTIKKLVRLLPIFIVPLGLLAYLLVNYVVTGDPFIFLTYQREHWGQSFGNISNTISYFAYYFFASTDSHSRYVLWGNQLLWVFLTLIASIWSARKLRGSEILYAACYLYAAFAPTWLLSAPRYATALITLYIALPQLAHRKWPYRILLVLSCLALFYYASVFTRGGQIL